MESDAQHRHSEDEHDVDAEEEEPCDDDGDLGGAPVGPEEQQRRADERRLFELENFTFSRPREPDEDPTGELAYRLMCAQLDKQERGFYRFPIDSVVDKLSEVIVTVDDNGDEMQVRVPAADLRLSRCGIGDKGAQALAEALKINTAVESLDLTDNHLTPVGSDFVVQALVGNRKVTKLVLAENRLGVQALAATLDNTIGVQVRTLLTKNTILNDLSLRANKIGDRDMERIAEGVIESNTLTRLDLSYNDIGPRGAAAIADMLAHCAADLRELRLEWNQLQRYGSLTVLKDGLLVNGTVRHFCMAWCGIGDEGGEVLGEAIRTSSVLEVVDVSNNRIGVKGAFAIAKGLAESTTLHRLSLNGNPLQDEGCAAILRALRSNDHIAMIDLDDTGAGKMSRAEAQETREDKLRRHPHFDLTLPRTLFDPESL